MDLIWIDRENLRDVVSLVHGAFNGWITDSMYAVYIANKKQRELELVLFFKQNISRLDNKIIEDEIIPYIEDGGTDYGINKVNLKLIHLSGTMGDFMEREAELIKGYYSVFVKYEFNPYDLED